DQSPLPALALTFAIDHEQWSQELRLTGSSDRLDWLVGAYYYQDERFFTATLENLGGFGSWASQDVETSAVFAQGTWAASDVLNITLGSRYTEDSRDLGTLASVIGGQPGTDQGTVLFSVSDSLDSSRTTWRLAADWEFAEDQMAYASISTGFKSGAFNTLLPSSPSGVVPADPEYTTAYELGIKGGLSDSVAITYNIALFYTDYENVQAQGTIANPTPISSLDTVSDAKIRGFEAEVSAYPLSGLTISLGVGFLDAEYTASPEALFNGLPIDGNELVMAPKWNFNGLIRYEFSVGQLGDAYLMSDFRWQDDVFFGPDNLLTEAQDAFALVNLHAGWISESEDWEVGAFLKNAADEAYYTHGVDSGGASQVGFTWGMPRIWGINVKKSF
ncbi:MAG: TonB-dependent receptor, partial [Pseudomonadales bacterium]